MIHPQIPPVGLLNASQTNYLQDLIPRCSYKKAINKVFMCLAWEPMIQIWCLSM